MPKCSIIAKSNDLNKNVLHKKQHYLQLQLFLEEVEEDVKMAMKTDLKLFASEERLYGKDKKVNHRLQTSYQVVEERISSKEQSDETLLYPLLTSGASAMKEKLTTCTESTTRWQVLGT